MGKQEQDSQLHRVSEDSFSLILEELIVIAETDLGPASVKIGTHPVLGDLTMVDCISEKKAIIARCEREAYTLIGFIVSKGGTWPVAL